MALRGSLFLILAAALFAAARWLPIPSLLQWVRDQGAWAPLLFILAYVLACVLLLPVQCTMKSKAIPALSHCASISAAQAM